VITALVLAATPSPTGTGGGQTPLDADLVTPGLWGFLLLFFLAIAVYFLGRSMARRVRGVNQRARLEEEAQAEREAAEAAARRAGERGPGGEPPAQG
jgi:hypothetical protein